MVGEKSQNKEEGLPMMVVWEDVLDGAGWDMTGRLGGGIGG